MNWFDFVGLFCINSRCHFTCHAKNEGKKCKDTYPEKSLGTHENEEKKNFIQMLTTKNFYVNKLNQSFLVKFNDCNLLLCLLIYNS